MVAGECDKDYAGALAVITCVLNRCESWQWENFGGDNPYKQITYPNQFTAYGGNRYNDFMSGRAQIPDCVKQAVNDALNKGVRNHTYTSFRTTSNDIMKKHPNGKDIGGNWYF